MKRKSFLLWLVLVIPILHVSGQLKYNTQSGDSTSIYFKSLCAYTDYLVENNLNPDNLYFEENILLTNKLPANLKAISLTYLDNYQLGKKLKKNNVIKINRIVPLRYNDGSFYVSIIQFRVKKNKQGLQFINTGGYKILFRYDCVDNDLKLSGIQKGNI